MKNRRVKRILSADRAPQPERPGTMVINSGAEFSWHDEHGRILKLRCGRIDAGRVNGYFAIYVNNVEVYSTTLEPGCGIAEFMSLGVVNTWAEMVFRGLYSRWENQNR